MRRIDYTVDLPQPACWYHYLHRKERDLMSHAELIERYLKGCDVLADAVSNVNPAILDKVPAPGKWTIREYTTHIFDAEIVSAARLRAMLAQPGADLMGFDQERWTAALHYEKQPVEDTLAAFRGLRRMTANMLRAATAEAWNNKGIHPKRGEMSVQALVEILAGHCENHARTIRELRERFGAAKG
ncbi:MAG: DinB family protein [Candidatus Korobacteraceae bacterium]|jgi:hypothetical protein